jgi:hypothetical protein
MWAWEKKSINFSSIESMEYRCLSSYAKASSIHFTGLEGPFYSMRIDDKIVDVAIYRINCGGDF